MEKNHQNTTRLVVNFFVTIFVIVVILTILLLLLYYLTPNNYIIELFDKSKYNLVKENIININPGSNFNLQDLDSNNDYLKFYQIINLDELAEQSILSNFKNNEKYAEKKSINLLIRNIMKSQNMTFNQDELIYPTYGSNIFILNQSDNVIRIKILIYRKKN